MVTTACGISDVKMKHWAGWRGAVWAWWGGRTSQTIQTIQTIRTSRTVWMGWTIRAFGVESGEGGMSVFFGIGCLRVGLLLI